MTGALEQPYEGNCVVNELHLLNKALDLPNPVHVATTNNELFLCAIQEVLQSDMEKNIVDNKYTELVYSLNWPITTYTKASFWIKRLKYASIVSTIVIKKTMRFIWP